MSDKPTLSVVPEELSIEKPEPFDLEKFKSKSDPTIAGAVLCQCPDQRREKRHATFDQ